MYTFLMSKFNWSEEKNRQLKSHADRGVCFEDIVTAIESGGLLDDIEHVNAKKYPHQRLYVVLLNDYVFGVPYVKSDDGVFLKTVFPSRKLTHIYLKEDDND
jgi:hypothetical protein